MNEKSSLKLFKILLAISLAIIITGVVTRIIYGFIGHIVVALGILVGLAAVYSHIKNLNNTIDELRKKLDDTKL